MIEHEAARGDVAKREEEILDFWNANNIFEKSKNKPAPNGEFVFYDGPPFATGLPHYGHILAGTIKDVIPRYKTMRGYKVRRRWGWDCHGLPLENQIEEELGLENKRDIEELGVEKFNTAAKNAVLRYADDWRKIVPRLGRWVDMDRDYKTMDATYTESVWWIFKQLQERGLVYRGFKSMHLCPRCGTTLSNFEVNLGYKDITDFAITVKFPLKDEKSTSLLVWTTTPWTLPGNMAAAVHKDKTYVKVSIEKERVILAKERLSELGENSNVMEEFSGAQLVGKQYEPPFDYFTTANIEGKEHAWKIYHASYVSMEEGTGAVHLAPAFGEEDMELAQEHGVPLVHHVDQEGRFTKDVKDFAGQLVKPKDTKEEPEKHSEADIEIIKYLAHKELLFKKEKITHSYPLCWRCDAPLLNYASNSWFVKAKQLCNKLVSENKQIHWVPNEVGKKRFGNWLENVRDWAISRERYWGAPLPVWKHPEKENYTFIGSVEELKKHTKRSGNRYFLMRHGEAMCNTKGILNADASVHNPLTEAGKRRAERAAQKLAPSKIDFIVHSPLERTRETAEIVARELKLSKEHVVEDGRLREVAFGECEGKTIEGHHSFFAFARAQLTKLSEGIETWAAVKRRTTEVLYDLEKKYEGKNILMISHNGSLQMIQAGARGYSADECVESIAENRFGFETGEVQELDFVPLSHNDDYELDLHRPYIDELAVVDGNGTRLQRVPDVFDCWFESGAMPYGQNHYPFENTDSFDPKSGWFKKAKGYPADFIAEGLDQTRGWFYSLLVLGVGLFKHSPYKNVIVNGMILAEDGQKMSKRLKNYPDPMDVTHRYGADALRYYLLSSHVVRGEDLNFSEAGVAEIMRKIVTRLSNVHAFYELYGEKEVATSKPSSNSLDVWIQVRLNELILQTTDAMERYELDQAARPIAQFVDDLSTWYLRRSRDRFKEGDGADKTAASATTRAMLIAVSKVMAPFMPFYAESLYRGLQGEKESVHLDDWPSSRKQSAKEKTLLADMEAVRAAVTLGLEARSKAGIKVRQPLRALTLKDTTLSGRDELLALVKAEVNVKAILFDPRIEGAAVLDTVLTDELKEEGMFRDFARLVQDLRKKARLAPSDRAVLAISTDERGRAFVEKHKPELAQATLLSEVLFTEVAGEVVSVGAHALTVSLRKA